MTFEVGDRVTGAVKDLEFPYEVGIVRPPTLLDRFRFWKWGYPINRNVLVQWGVDPWDAAWQDPSEIQHFPNATRRVP